MSKIKLALDVVNDLRSLADSIETLADAMEGNEPEAKTTSHKAKTTKQQETKQPEVQQQEKKKETETKKQPTLEELRALMAEKNREGHREEVKAIILNHGSNKLTSLDPEHYAEVLKEVGEIN